MRGLVRSAAGVVAVVATMMTAIMGASPAIASASVAAHWPLRPAGLSLGQAPAGLRAAVRRTPGLAAAGAGSVFQQAKLTAAGGAAGDHAGWSVAIAGSTAVVGAYGTASGTGAAYVFTRSGSTWSQQAELTAAGGAAGDQFGYSVAIAGSTVVVGADGTDSFAGAAYVFARSGATWTQQAELADPGATAEDFFGAAVAISGSTVVVGADGTNSQVGAAYVFVGSGGTWSPQATLTAAGGLFGAALAISGSTVVVGADGNDPGIGTVYVFTRSGTTWSQQAELTDGAAFDEFGGSVAIAGSTVVVGADGTNSATGAAYVFTRSGSTWSQQAELTAADGAASDDFGSSVAVAGSTAVIGAPAFTGSGAGAAYTFTHSGSTWTQQAKLTAAGGAAGGDFGRSVAISGSTAAVGADGTNSATGAAYVFVLPSQQARLAATGRARDFFGWSVAISGSTAVVGAWGTSKGAGVAYVFTRSGTTWTRQAELTNPGGTATDGFGYAVAISGSTAVVGADETNSDTGTAYVFVRSGTTWTQQAELADPGGAAGDEFGAAVAIAGSTMVVGADETGSATGAAYVFVRSGTTWAQQAELTAADAAAGDFFGWSVAIAGSTVVAGAPDISNSGGGAAYVFTRSGTTWTQQAELADPGAVAGDNFGHSVAISGSTAVVGAWGSNSGAGAAYVFARSGTTWSQQAELTDPGGATFDNLGWSVALAGSTAVVSAPSGNSSGTGVAYVFARSGTTWTQQAELTGTGSAAYGYFGGSVAIAESSVAMGAYETNSDTGAAYLFGNV